MVKVFILFYFILIFYSLFSLLSHHFILFSLLSHQSLPQTFLSTSPLFFFHSFFFSLSLLFSLPLSLATPPPRPYADLCSCDFFFFFGNDLMGGFGSGWVQMVMGGLVVVGCDGQIQWWVGRPVGGLQWWWMNSVVVCQPVDGFLWMGW